MVSTDGFGFFSDFAVIYRWARTIWTGQYTGLYPYPLMVLLAPLTLLPVYVAAAIWLAFILVIFVVTLKRQSLYWLFFAPVVELLYLGQLDPLFWLAWRSKRPAVWALLSLKPQLLPLALPAVFSSKRNALEFFAALAALHAPFLLLRPAWPLEWIRFIAGYQNRVTNPVVTASGSLILSYWVIPYALMLLVLLLLRKRNLGGVLFLANPLLLPYDYSLLAGSVSRIAIPLSWVALWAGTQVKAGWPFAIMLIATLAIETVRERGGLLFRRPVISTGKEHL